MLKNRFHGHHVFLVRFSERKSQISMFHKNASSNPTKILIVAMGVKNMPFRMQPVLTANSDVKHVFLALVTKNIGQIANFHKNAHRNMQDGSNERY